MDLLYRIKDYYKTAPTTTTSAPVKPLYVVVVVITIASVLISMNMISRENDTTQKSLRADIEALRVENAQLKKQLPSCPNRQIARDLAITMVNQALVERDFTVQRYDNREEKVLEITTATDRAIYINILPQQSATFVLNRVHMEDDRVASLPSYTPASDNPTSCQNLSIVAYIKPSVPEHSMDFVVMPIVRNQNGHFMVDPANLKYFHLLLDNYGSPKWG